MESSLFLPRSLDFRIPADIGPSGGNPLSPHSRRKCARHNQCMPWRWWYRRAM